MKYSVTALVFLFGCAPRARFAEEERRTFVKGVTQAVAVCARHDAPPTCPEADRLAAAYYSRKSQ